MAINLDAFTAAAMRAGAAGRPESERLNGSADPFRRWLEQAAAAPQPTPAMLRNLASLLTSALDRAGMHAMLAEPDDAAAVQSGRALMPAVASTEMLMALRSVPAGV